MKNSILTIITLSLIMICVDITFKEVLSNQTNQKNQQKTVNTTKNQTKLAKNCGLNLNKLKKSISNQNTKSKQKILGFNLNKGCSMTFNFKKNNQTQLITVQNNILPPLLVYGGMNKLFDYLHDKPTQRISLIKKYNKPKYKKAIKSKEKKTNNAYFAYNSILLGYFASSNSSSLRVQGQSEQERSTSRQGETAGEGESMGNSEGVTADADATAAAGE